MTNHLCARRRLLVAPAAVLALAFPPTGAAAAEPAYAGTCTVSQTTLVYTAMPGVANEVTVQAPGLTGYSLPVRDEAGPVKGCSPDPRDGEAVLVGNVIKKIKVVAGDGDDVVVIAADINVPLPTVVYGGDGDELRGGRGRDDLSGNAGNDELNGGSGGDDLDGGAGTDDCNGGPGADRTTACE
ncbi:hypothetical protein [Microbispora sp. NPDC049633]|uniref:hypothetical protein n=1 Tax=Microbispora sp. NPDC049633 TaxID=3154355 RepID=UPI0034234EFD